MYLWNYSQTCFKEVERETSIIQNLETSGPESKPLQYLYEDRVDQQILTVIGYVFVPK